MFDRHINIDSREGFSPDEEPVMNCSICGQSVDSSNVTGNPQISHWDCIFEALAPMRAKQQLSPK